MQFNQPLFLFGLFALLIPIFIHLFNFRRYKITYFSNVKLLQDIVTKTKRESKLQHIIVLCLRILGISALVIAFAQPYIPNKNNNNQKGNLVSIFIDNSFSMDAESKNGNFINEAMEAAKNVVNAFSYNDDFILITQDFSGKESHILNKDEILNMIDEIEITNQSHTLDEILNFEKGVTLRSMKENRLFYYISDFQKNNFNLTTLQNDTSKISHLLQVGAKEISNVSVDSCWFLTPILKENYQVTLMVRVHNYSNNDVVKLPIRLYINEEQAALASIDIQAQSYTDYPINYTIHHSGIQAGKLEINDSPIVFDDRLFFTYQINPSTDIIVIDEKESNRYLTAMYGHDSLFLYEEMNINQINYSRFGESELIVLDQVNTISSGLSDELKKFVTNGGNLLIFPGEKMDVNSWNTFTGNLSLPNYQSLVKSEIKIGSINYESIYFKNSIDKSDEKWDMPMISQYYTFTPTQSAKEEIISLENGNPVLTSYSVGKGKVILSSIALNDNFGSAHKSAILFVPLHNIGIISQINSVLYNVIGVDNMQILPRHNIQNNDLYTLKATHGSHFEFVPEQRTSGNESILYFHNQVEEAGFYDVLNNQNSIFKLAFNYNRAESNLTYYSKDELDKIVENSDGHISNIDVTTKDLTKQIANHLQGKQLWQYFIYTALLMFLGEILILKLWGRVRIK